MAPGARPARQQIPRPRGWRPGPPAPWSALPPTERARISLSHVRRALARPGPATSGRSPARPRDVSPLELPPAADPRPAAVLCLLFEEAGEAHVVLTRRAAQLRSHAGEVAFPGGRLGPGETALRAALREAYEEIGVEVTPAQVIGQLTPLTTYRSPATVQCFVATFGGPGAGGEGLRRQVEEVEKVFWAPLSLLAADGTFHEELWPGLPAGRRAVPFFTLDEDVVWGATGRLLFDLMTRVLPVPPPPGRHSGSLGTR